MKKIMILVSLFSFLNEAVAADKTEKDNVAELYKMFDIDVYSLSKKNEDAFDAASSIYVLTSEDIRRSGATSIPEALRLVPGLQVARIDGHKWAISARGFNAQFSNKLLVMVDGRTVYTPLFSGSFWDTQDYVLDDIEKIEVIRGSGGAIWGANAVNGIINIITKNAADSQGTYLSAIAGTDDKVMEARYGGATKELNHYRIYAKQVFRDELYNLSTKKDNNDGYRQSQAGFRYDIRSIKDNKVTVHGDLRSGLADDYFNLSSSSAKNNDKHSKGANLVVGWDKTLSNKASFSLQSYFDYDQFDGFLLAMDTRTADVDFQYFYDFNRDNQFSAGLGYRLISDQLKETPLNNGTTILDYSPQRLNNEIFSAFLQDKIGLISDVLYLTLGSKFQRNDYTGFEFQPSAKLTYFPSRNQTFWASVSRAVRTPTRGEDSIRINNPTTANNGFTLQAGSNTYESENVIAYELGYRVKPTGRSLIDIAIFYNDYSDLRTFNSRNGFSGFTTNLGEGESYGAEVTAKWQIFDNLRLETGYDFLKLDVRNLDQATESSNFPIFLAEGQSPKNQFRFRANYDLTSKIEFDNIVYYVDSLPLSGSTTGSNGVPSYVRFDTRVGYLLNSNIDLSIGVQNLTDRRHQEFGSGTFANKTEVGRTVYFKVAARLW